MGTVMIKCPKTDEPLSTGISMPQASFDSSGFENNTVGPCPHCGDAHAWSKGDAYVEE